MLVTDLLLLGQAGPGSPLGWVFAIALIVVGLAVLLVLAQLFSLWVQAYACQAGVSFVDLIGMRLRKVDSRRIVLGKIYLVKAGIHDVSVDDLVSHYLAGGRVPNVVNAIIAASRANIDLDWQNACAIDLAGGDVLDAVQTSVDPMVTDVPGAADHKGTM